MYEYLEVLFVYPRSHFSFGYNSNCVWGNLLVDLLQNAICSADFKLKNFSQINQTFQSVFILFGLLSSIVQNVVQISLEMLCY